MNALADVTMVPVTSSNVMSVGYDDGTHELHVLFKGNRYYIYTNVPHDKFDEMLKAPSVGSYMNENIKKEHQFRRVG